MARCYFWYFSLKKPAKILHTKKCSHLNFSLQKPQKNDVSIVNFFKKIYFCAKISQNRKREKWWKIFKKKKSRENATNLHCLAIFTKKNCKKYLNEKSRENTTKYRKMSFNSFSNLAIFGAKIQIFEKLAIQTYLFTVFGVKSSNENIFGIFSGLSLKAKNTPCFSLYFCEIAEWMAGASVTVWERQKEGVCLMTFYIAWIGGTVASFFSWWRQKSAVVVLQSSTQLLRGPSFVFLLLSLVLRKPWRKKTEMPSSSSWTFSSPSSQ